jgi:hypothetical protein
MNKHMLPGTNALVKRFTFAFAFFSVIISSTQLYAQCGLSPFLQGATLTPTTAWTNVSVGSGTYTNFSVTNGNFYSFRYTTPNSNLGATYLWDMTLSTSSTAIAYNNSLTPLNDSWTNGAGCPATTSPTSAEWFSTFTGTLRVNTKTDVSGTCTNWISGQNSAVLQYKTCAPRCGSGFREVAFGTLKLLLQQIFLFPTQTLRYGYYVDN